MIFEVWDKFHVRCVGIVNEEDGTAAREEAVRLYGKMFTVELLGKMRTDEDRQLVRRPSRTVILPKVTPILERWINTRLTAHLRMNGQAIH